MEILKDIDEDPSTYNSIQADSRKFFDVVQHYAKSNLIVTCKYVRLFVRSTLPYLLPLVGTLKISEGFYEREIVVFDEQTSIDFPILITGREIADYRKKKERNKIYLPLQNMYIEWKLTVGWYKCDQVLLKLLNINYMGKIPSKAAEC